MEKQSKKRIATQIITGIGAVVAFVCGMMLAGCNNNKTETKILETPVNLQIADEYLTWDEVPEAESYIVEINGEEYTTPTNSLDIMEITNEPASYKLFVSAIGDHKTTFDSDFSEILWHNVYLPEHLVFTERSDGNYEVSAVKDIATRSQMTGKLIIPSEYNGRRVTSIARSGFTLCGNITSVYVPDCVEAINHHAFCKCGSMRRIRLSENLEKISESVFADCLSLEQIDLPSSVTSIEKSAFNKCSSLKKLEIPTSVTEIADTAFADCSSLEELTLNEGLLSLGSIVFKNCDSLDSLVLPCSLQNLSPSAMLSYKMANVSFDVGGNAKFKIEGNCIIRISDNFLVEGCAESVIPDTVKIIGDNSFLDCSGLKMIVIPYGVTEIRQNAFQNCHNLREVYIPSSVKVIERLAFQGCCYASITIPESVEKIEHAAFTGIESTPSCGAYSCEYHIKLWAFNVIEPSQIRDIGRYNAGVFAYDDEGKYPYVNSMVFSGRGLDSSIFRENHHVMVAPCRKGYTFLGWTTEEGGSLPLYKPEIVSIEHTHGNPNYSLQRLITENVHVTFIPKDAVIEDETVLYAVWQKNG